MRHQELHIDGMTCAHCVMSVTKELSALIGVKVETVEIGKACILYDQPEISPEDIERAVGKAGYRLMRVEDV